MDLCLVALIPTKKASRSIQYGIDQVRDTYQPKDGEGTRPRSPGANAHLQIASVLLHCTSLLMVRSGHGLAHKNAPAETAGATMMPLSIRMERVYEE